MVTAPANAFGLPFRLNSFVGRAQELLELGGTLERTHVLTLVGPPGVGKTRLALQLAQHYESAQDGRVLWLDVASANETLLSREFLAFVAELRERRVLIVLDGCSQSLSRCRVLADALVRSDERIQLLATSRERLGAGAEIVWPVSPLAVPPVDSDDVVTVAQSPAVMLFLARMQLVDPEFALTDASGADVARLCRATDGLPLAIEVAASRCAYMTPRSAVDRIDWVLGLNQTNSRDGLLVQSLERTMRLLTPDERAFLAELSVFAGSWDVHAAQAVCSASASAVLPLVSRLVACSLVQKIEDEPGREVRYAIANDIIRRYADHALNVTGRSDDVRRKHALWFQRVANSAAFGSAEFGQVDWLRSILPNFVAALTWAVDAGDAEIALSFANLLHGLWYLDGNFPDAREWFEKILALPGGSNASRALAMNWAGMHAMAEGDGGAAFAWSARACQLADQEHEPLLRAVVLDGHATMLLNQGSLGAAEAATSEVLRVCADMRVEWLESTTLCRQARIQLESGRVQVAQLLAERALNQLGDTTNEWLQLRIRQVLGRIAFDNGDWITAGEHLANALQAARRMDDREGTVELLIDQSRVEFRRGKTGAARQLAAETFHVSGRISALCFIHRLEQAVAVSCRVRPEAALRLSGAVASLRDRTGAQRLPREEVQFRSSLDLARAHLRSSTAIAAVTAGRRLDRDAAVLLARDLLEPTGTAAAHSGSSVGTLTVRELRIAVLLSRGLTNRAIASELFISEGTVRAHVERILSKLGLKSRVEVSTWLARDD